MTDETPFHVMLFVARFRLPVDVVARFRAEAPIESGLTADFLGPAFREDD